MLFDNKYMLMSVLLCVLSLYKHVKNAKAAATAFYLLHFKI